MLQPVIKDPAYNRREIYDKGYAKPGDVFFKIDDIWSICFMMEFFLLKII